MMMMMILNPMRASYEDMALFVKKFSVGKFKGRFQKKKVRKCYNCEETNHFSNECPYEKREDKPRFRKPFPRRSCQIL